MKLAPVIVFAYNRADRLQEMLESLHSNDLNEHTELFIFCDGPKKGADEKSLQKIKMTREVANKKKWCGKVTVSESLFNLGLSASVINGVTSVIEKHGRAIVIEDDVILSPYFLKFMNESLNIYQNNKNVLSIGSWSYFFDANKIEDDTFFFRFPDCKGWATWNRAWKLFESDPETAMKKIIDLNLQNEFNAGLTHPYFSEMLNDQIMGRINSWAIRWTATAVINNMLSLFPKITLSKDKGIGAEATHEQSGADYNNGLVLAASSINVEELPVVENKIAVEEWKAFYYRYFIPDLSLTGKIRRSIRGMFPVKWIEKYRQIRYGK